MKAKAPKTVTAREINDAPWEPPWEPLPGHVKRRCPNSRYLFAVPVAVAETELAPRCPDCAARQRPTRSS